MNKFETGKTYQTRSICDSGCIFSITVLSRTAKMLTFKQWDGQTRRTKIQNDTDGEYIQPDRYSMSPIYRASREAA